MNSMKDHMFQFLAVSAAALALPTAAYAHGQPGEGPRACISQPHFQRDAMPPPEMGPGLHAPGLMPFPHHLRELELADAQQDKLFELMHEQAPRHREKAKAASKALEDLRRLSASERYDAAQARALANAHAQALAEMALMHAELDAKIRAVLTPEQRKKLDELRGKPEARLGWTGKRS
jgi:Spy/CpxP family protein refolding chaperone